MDFPDFPNWHAVAAFLKAHVKPDETLLAPDHFLDLFAGVYPPQIRQAWIGVPLDWFVLNVEALPRLDHGVFRDMLANAHPVYANPAFFVFTRRDDLPRRAMQEPAFQPLQMFLMANGVIGAGRKPPARRGAVITTYNRPAMLAGTVASLRATGIEILVVDDGSQPDHQASNRAIADEAGAAYLVVPGNRGLPTALNCGLGYFLADERVTWISTFNDDIAVDPALYTILATVEATGEFPLMTGYLSPHHKVHGTRVIEGREIALLRSLPGQHIHASQAYWRSILPIPTPYLGAPKPTGGRFPGQGADEDWWIGSYSPR
jgi:hypothetical protein